MDYFAYSQQVKLQIQASAHILSQVREALSGKKEEIGYGSTVDVIAVGRLDSSLHVALRVYREDGPFGQYCLDMQMDLMEQYCQNAEFLAGQDKRVPTFCVGVAYRDRAGILLEDITQDGELKLSHASDEAIADVIKDGKKVDQVYLDIDHAYRITDLKPLFFLPEYRISLDD